MERPASHPFIKEVILENFMSYDYGRVRLGPGLNVILGPNGAGKSSILLGISVALGQAYTERSRRLSDLVKRGKEIARVTLLLDNSPSGGRKPLPFRADTIHLSRYVRKDGTYWFEVDFKEAAKGEIVDMLGKLGLNPDNMLIIMHQGLGDTFSVIRPEEKLALVEDAVGLSSYRVNLLEAKARLEAITTEEEEKRRELEAATASLARWQENYEKSVRIKELRGELSKLRAEEGWCRVAREEEKLAAIREKMLEVGTAISDLESKVSLEGRNVEGWFSGLNAALDVLVKGERNLARLKADLSSSRSLVSAYEILKPVLRDAPADLTSAVEKALLEGQGRTRTLEDEVSSEERRLASELAKALQAAEGYATSKAKLAVLEYRLGEKKKELKSLQGQEASVEEELRALTGEAERLGPRVPSSRSLSDVLTATKFVEMQLAQLGDIPEEVEQIYRDFQKKIQELSSRLAVLKENKEATLKDIDDRFRVWRNEIRSLLQDVNEEFNRVLGLVGARGRVYVAEERDPLKAGLQVEVGFRGQDLVPLDAYTQSGGERSSAMIALLIAIQRHVKSPFRAVDEFDVHMDPSSRESFVKALHEYFKANDGTQYLIITPGAPAFFDPSAHYIMVQKVASASQAKVVRDVIRAE
jgi:chromosome segregation protein